MHQFKYYKKYIFGLVVVIAIFTLFVHLYMQPHENSPSRSSFIKFMLLHAEQANEDILQQRQKLVVLYGEFKKRQPLTPLSKEWLFYLSSRYDVKKPDLTANATWETLLKRVDIVPNSLVIAQAINESDWGQSRFAQEGNNYFGMWCYKHGCGIRPEQKNPDHFYAVKRYATPLRSVQDYMRNLNSHNGYKLFRTERANLRAHNKLITGIALVNTLIFYSQRRNAYVISIRRLITSYNLTQYDKLLPDNSDLSLFVFFNEFQKHQTVKKSTKKITTKTPTTKREIRYPSKPKSTNTRNTHK